MFSILRSDLRDFMKEGFPAIDIGKAIRLEVVE